MEELKISNAAAKVINLQGGTVADAIDIKGGYFVAQFVETTTTGEEGKIPPYACVEGALCYCIVGTEEKPGNKFYQYKSGEWVEALNVDLSNYKEPITVDGNPITIVDDKGSTSITGSSITTETDVFKIVDTSGNTVAQISDEGLVVTDIRTENIKHNKDTGKIYVTGADVELDGDLILLTGGLEVESLISSPNDLYIEPSGTTYVVSNLSVEGKIDCIDLNINGAELTADDGNIYTSGGLTVASSMDSNSARISNGLYVGTSITHNEEEILTIGNSSNNSYVNFVEDISVGSDMAIITASGDIHAEGNLYAGGDINIEGNINFDSTPLGITASAFNTGEGETCKSVIGFNGEGDPSVISNSGYIRLYDAGPNGYDGLLTLADSPTYSISMDALDTVCNEGWNKTNTSNKTNTKMYLVGATTQTGNQKTYSNSDCYIGTDNSLYSNNKKTAVEELTMPVTKKFLREYKSEYREPLVDSNCKHFSLIDLYVKDDSGELKDLNFVLTIFGTISVVWGYSDESIENTGGYPAGSATTRCRNGIRLVGYINHLTKTFTGSLKEKPYSSSRENTLRTYVNEPITDFSASIDHCTIDGSMIWWSLDSASTDIKAL